jgi:hypothetical protein
MKRKKSTREKMRASLANLTPRELAARDQFLTELRAYYDKKELSLYDLDTRFAVTATYGLLNDAYENGQFERTAMGIIHLLMETQIKIDDGHTTTDRSEV